MITTFLRLMVAYLLLCRVNYLVLGNEFFDDNELSRIAFSLLLSLAASIVYCHAIWFYFMYKKNRKVGGKFFLLKNILFPIGTYMIFAIPFIDFYVIDNQLIISAFFGAFLLYDKAEKISEFIWRNRFYEYSICPDSGVVSNKLLEKTKALVIALYVFIPVGGYLVKFIYK